MFSLVSVTKLYNDYWEFVFLISIIIKFPYNPRSDWLKQRALSEIRKQVDDI